MNVIAQNERSRKLRAKRAIGIQQYPLAFSGAVYRINLSDRGIKNDTRSCSAIDQLGIIAICSAAAGP